MEPREGSTSCMRGASYTRAGAPTKAGSEGMRIKPRHVCTFRALFRSWDIDALERFCTPSVEAQTVGMGNLAHHKDVLCRVSTRGSLLGGYTHSPPLRLFPAFVAVEAFF